MSFDEFLKAKQEEAKTKESFDKNARIEQFRTYVESFYSQLKNDWLADYYETMHPVFEDITIHEELLGEYNIRSLILTVGNEKIQFKPKGTILIGTPGRIDVVCNYRRAMLILTGEKARTPKARIINDEKKGKQPPKKLVWKLVDERGMMSFVDLNADSIQELIMAVAR